MIRQHQTQLLIAKILIDSTQTTSMTIRNLKQLDNRYSLSVIAYRTCLTTTKDSLHCLDGEGRNEVVSSNSRSGLRPSKQLLLSQVKMYTKLALMCVGGIAFLYALYLCSENLFGSNQPNNIASRVFDIVRNTDEIVATTGEKDCA